MLQDENNYKTAVEHQNNEYRDPAFAGEAPEEDYEDDSDYSLDDGSAGPAEKSNVMLIEEEKVNNFIQPLFQTVNIMEMSGQNYGKLFKNE